MTASAPPRPPAPLNTSAFYSDPGTTEQHRQTQADHRWRRTLSDLHSRPQTKGFLVLQVFRKQDQAIEFQQSSHQPSMPLRLFSFEDNPTEPGRRKFLVTTIRDFWYRYAKMDPHQRHYYEMIQTGWPCHLYFDIEFDRGGVNGGVDGNSVVKALTHVACKAYAVVVCGMEWECETPALTQDGVSVMGGGTVPCVVVDLTSTTPVKFSRHVVVRVPGHAFHDNSHAGRFVTALVLALRDELMPSGCTDPNIALHRSDMNPNVDSATSRADAPSDLRSAIRRIVRDLDDDMRTALINGHVTVTDASSSTHHTAAPCTSRQLCVDTGVYSRNRNFRLWLSSKITKQTVLEATPECTVPITMDERGFRLTLVTDVPAVEDQHNYRNNNNKQLRLVEIDDAFRFHVVPVCVSDLHALRMHPSASSLPTTSSSMPLPNTVPYRQSPSQGVQTTQFSDMEAYLAHAIESSHPGKQQAFIRSSMFFQDSLVLVCTIGGNRYCHNIGREHKSNGVFYVVHLAEGFYTQKCYDPDCRHFRSREIPFPIEISPFLGSIVADMDDATDTDIIDY